jgi:hypothetical protein
MKTLQQNWWKLIVVVFAALTIRIILLQLLPLRSSSTFELAPSIISQNIGMIPTAAIVVSISYAVIASILIIIQENIHGNTFERFLRCSLPFSLIWFFAVLESVSSLGKPLLPEIMIGLTDILPILIMGWVISFWVSKDFHKIKNAANNSTAFSIFIIAFSYFVGRYFMYTLIHINSGYFSHDIQTFSWTLEMGLAIGIAYFLLREGVKGKSPFSRALWFGCIAFGIYWTLNNFFMPFVFDMSFIEFTPTIMNYVFRVIFDIAFVSLGIWIFEKSFQPISAP